MTSSAAASAAPPGVSVGARRWLLFLLALIYTSNFVDRTIFGAVAQAVKRDLHLNDTEVGLLGGLAFAAFYTFLGIPMARLSERMKRVNVISISLVVWSAMTVACGLAQNFVQLAIARTLVGIGEAGCLPSSQSLISDCFPASRRAMALAIWSLGIPIGSLTGLATGGWIAQHYGWRIAFMSVGIPGLVLALLALTLREPPRGHSDPGYDAATPAPPLTAVFRKLASKPSALWVCAGATLSATGGYGMSAFMASYFIRRFGLDYGQAGLIAGIIAGAPTIIGLLSGGALTDWIGRKDMRSYAWVSAAGVTICGPLFAFGFMQATWLAAAVLLCAAALFQQAYLAPTFAVANSMTPPRMRATSIAIISFAWNLLGQGLGPVFVGLISDNMSRRLQAGSGADFLSLCVPATNACSSPQTTGLQYALIAIPMCYLLGTVCFLISARTMRRDFAAG